MTRRCLRNDLDALFMYNYRASQVVSGAAFPGDSKPLLTRHLIYQYHSKMYIDKSRQTREKRIGITLGGVQMDPLWRTALWQQFGATIDMLENALLACPSTHWNGRLWSDHSDHPLPPESAEFWYITYHTLFWLDLYLTGSLEGFAPPTPFTLDELDPAGVLPERPYTRDELHAYLVDLRKKCQTTIAGLSDEKAHQQVDFPWIGGKPISFLELLLYNMRHVQEHAAQLNMFLGQNAIDGASDWVSWVKADEGGE